jgi:hypothetical protein
VKDKDYFAVAAKAVAEQLADNAALHVPLDPDVADFMGAFGGGALCLTHRNPMYRKMTSKITSLSIEPGKRAFRRGTTG